MTRKLYFEDVGLREFNARVEERIFHEGRPAVVLDQTAFYPESGGQPEDRGRLGEAEVLHVFEEGERIIHVLDREPAGSRDVKGVLDWVRRFDHMQQHSGQHVLSQSFVELIGGETRSFHLGEQSTTLEIGLNAAAEKDLERVELRANEVVFEDREIKTYFVPAEKIGTIPLRRPPKKEGTIRVVEVSGFDFSACGGTHCRRTGEIGLIKILRWDKVRNNLRFEFLCGWRAWRDYRDKNRSVLEISQKLSIHEKDAATAVERTLQENKLTRKKMKRFQEALASFEARETVEKGSGWLVRKLWTDKTPEEAKLLALNIIRIAPRTVLFAVRGGERDHLIFASSEALPLDMRELVPLITERAKGKGGGGASLVEAVVEPGADLEAVLASAEAFLEIKRSASGGKG